MVGGIVVDETGMVLWNAVDLEWGLWQSVGMQLMVVGWHTEGLFFAAVGHCSFGMQLG